MQLLIKNWKTGELCQRKIAPSQVHYRKCIGTGVPVDVELVIFKGQFFVDTKRNKIVRKIKHSLRKYSVFINTQAGLVWAGETNQKPADVCTRFTAKQILQYLENNYVYN